MNNENEKFMKINATNSTGWNLAFGFEKHELAIEMTEDIGTWSVTYWTLHIPYIDEKSGEFVKYHRKEEELPVRPCRSNEFNLTDIKEKD
jgi:hypothetical protein